VTDAAAWAAALRHAARVWGIAPEAFWLLSLREWRWLTAAETRPLEQGELAALMAAFPDGAGGGNDKDNP